VQVHAVGGGAIHEMWACPWLMPWGVGPYFRNAPLHGHYLTLLELY